MKGIKLPISKANLAPLPEPIRSHIKQWKARRHRRFFHLESRASFHTAEDARYTAYNIASGRSLSAKADGEFAGIGDFMPNRAYPLPPGNWIVEESWFCGTPFLSVFFNDTFTTTTPAQLATGAVHQTQPALENTTP